MRSCSESTRANGPKSGPKFARPCTRSTRRRAAIAGTSADSPSAQELRRRLCTGSTASVTRGSSWKSRASTSSLLTKAVSVRSASSARSARISSTAYVSRPPVSPGTRNSRSRPTSSLRSLTLRIIGQVVEAAGTLVRWRGRAPSWWGGARARVPASPSTDLRASQPGCDVVFVDNEAATAAPLPGVVAAAREPRLRGWRERGPRARVRGRRDHPRPAAERRHRARAGRARGARRGVRATTAARRP